MDVRAMKTARATRRAEGTSTTAAGGGGGGFVVVVVVVEAVGEKFPGLLGGGWLVGGRVRRSTAIAAVPDAEQGKKKIIAFMRRSEGNAEMRRACRCFEDEA
jgi:hypothetical protein